MTLTQILNIGIRATGISSLFLILGALFFENYYHKIDITMKCRWKNKKILDWIAFFIDRSINHISGTIWYILWWIILWSLWYFSILSVWLISSIIVYIMVGILKLLSKKQRPKDARFRLYDFSFPSGHTAIATTWFLNLALFISRYVDHTGILLSVFFWAILWGIVVGRSRLYLKVHWISDVLVGLLLGIFCFLISCSFILG